MRWMFDDATNRAGLASEFFADPNLKRGDVESETACYRVALEAVANVARHAQATEAEVRTQKLEGAVGMVEMALARRPVEVMA